MQAYGILLSTTVCIMLAHVLILNVHKHLSFNSVYTVYVSLNAHWAGDNFGKFARALHVLF